MEWGGYDRVNRAADSSCKIVKDSWLLRAVGGRHLTSADVSNATLNDSGKKEKNENLLFFTSIDLAETPFEVSDSYQYRSYIRTCAPVYPWIAVLPLAHMRRIVLKGIS